jgi:hypothetical protein
MDREDVVRVVEMWLASFWALCFCGDFAAR